METVERSKGRGFFHGNQEDTYRLSLSLSLGNEENDSKKAFMHLKTKARSQTNSWRQAKTMKKKKRRISSSSSSLLYFLIDSLLEGQQHEAVNSWFNYTLILLFSVILFKREARFSPKRWCRRWFSCRWRWWEREIHALLKEKIFKEEREEDRWGIEMSKTCCVIFLPSLSFV